MHLRMSTFLNFPNLHCATIRFKQHPRVSRSSDTPTRLEARSTSTAIASPNYNCDKFDPARNNGPTHYGFPVAVTKTVPAFYVDIFILWPMVGLTFLDLGAKSGASRANPALQEFFRGARQFFPGPPIFSPSMLCGSTCLQHFPQNGDTPQSSLGATQLRLVAPSALVPSLLPAGRAAAVLCLACLLSDLPGQSSRAERSGVWGLGALCNAEFNQLVSTERTLLQKSLRTLQLHDREASSDRN